MKMAQDLFAQINHAVLDLQASELQSYERPLKALARLLRHPDLEETNKTLTEGLDVEAFIAAGERSQGSMAGSARLPWPEEPEKVIGLSFLLIQKFADQQDSMMHFGFTFYRSGSKAIAGIHAVVRQIIIPFVRDYKTVVLSKGNTVAAIPTTMSNKIFIVHGHDAGARESVARFLGQLGLDPIILHEQASRGRTVIEKVEAHSDVGFAVVLLTPDDEGCVKGGTLEPRTRQNVLLELGYFIGRLGRDRVCALKRGDVEIPSDFAGVVWGPMDDGNGWKQTLGRELQAADYKIDWNQVMR